MERSAVSRVFIWRTKNGPRDQELLDTQMRRFQPPSHRDGLMILAIVGVFLAGMTAGGFLFAAYRGQPTVQTASSDDGKTALAFFLNGTPNVAR